MSLTWVVCYLLSFGCFFFQGRRYTRTMNQVTFGYWIRFHCVSTFVCSLIQSSTFKQKDLFLWVVKPRSFVSQGYDPSEPVRRYPRQYQGSGLEATSTTTSRRTIHVLPVWRISVVNSSLPIRFSVFSRVPPSDLVCPSPERIFVGTEPGLQESLPKFQNRTT